MFHRATTSIFSVLLLIMTLGGTADAQDLSASEVLLTIERGTAEDDIVTFDIARLDQLPQVVFRTSTIWTSDVVEFSGPPLYAVLESLDATSEIITAFAMNDYSMTISGDSISENYPIVATRMNGERFSVRDRGPLWIVFPYDSDPEYQDERIYAQSVWQLVKLTIN